MLIYGDFDAYYSTGDVIPAGFKGTKITYSGAPEMTNPTNMAASTQHVDLTPAEITPSQVTIDRFGTYAVIRGAVFSGNNIVVGDESIAYYNTLMSAVAPTDGAIYDITGVCGYHNSAQFLPISWQLAGAGEFSLQIIPAQYDDTKPVEVTITPVNAAEGDVAISYTIDGSDPAGSDAITYTGPFTLYQSATVKAYAIDNAMNEATAERSYEINMPALSVVPDIPSGTYYSTQYVTFTARNAIGNVEYEVTFNGGETYVYDGESFEYTVEESGDIVIAATDSLGRTFSGTFSYEILPYTENSTFELITSAEGLTPGRQYLIVAKADDNENELAYMNGSAGNYYTRSTVSHDNLTAVDAWPPSYLNSSDLLNETVLILGQWEGYYTLYNVELNKYLKITTQNSSKNQLTSGSLDDLALASITFDEDSLANIIFDKDSKYTHNNLRYNNTKDTERFSCYVANSNMPKVYLYGGLQEVDSPHLLTITTNIEDDDLGVYMWVNDVWKGDIQSVQLKANDQVRIFARHFDNDPVNKITGVTVTTAGGETITPQEVMPDEDDDYYGFDLPYYVFTMPDDDATATVVQESRFHTLTYISGSTGGNILFSVDDGWQPNDHDTISLKEGREISFAVHADNNDDYEYTLDHITMVGQETGTNYDSSVRYISGDVYYFTMPQEDVEFTAYFTYKLYDITVTENEGGTVTFDNVVTVDGVSKQRKNEIVWINAVYNDPDYKVVDRIQVLRADTQELLDVNYNGSRGMWYFTMPNSNVRVKVYYQKAYHYVTLNPVGCYINGLDTDELRYRRVGEDVTFSYTVFDHYEYRWMSLASRTNGNTTYPITDNGDGTYSFTMPGEEVMLTVNCAQVEYEVEIASLRNCEIECDDLGFVPAGNTVRFHVTPTDIYGGKYGYVIKEVKLVSYTGDIQGVDITDEGDGWYSFTMPSRDVRLYATTGFPVTAEQSELGTIDVSKPVADEYETVTVTVTPTDPVNHAVDQVTITYTVYQHSTQTETLTPNGDGAYTITMPRAAVTVRATYCAPLDGVTFAEGNHWATWYGDTDLAVPEGLTAYVVTDVTDDEANVEAIDYIPAGVGVLLYSETAGSSFPARSYSGETSTVNSLLEGSVEGMNISNGYVLLNNTFVLAKSGALAAHRCYLPMPSAGAGAPRMLRINNGDVITGINDLTTNGDKNQVHYFDVSGRHIGTTLQNAPSGIYITSDGRKVVK
ncbi:MAG: chitobiase/beta-hexosaminidase C-terminal domain-containing protein [Muribaculaceae bacterium]|nr:chitobiase/beta-hexosaminidase C-terminal domain-containing protein [Muribaculaceae bacterium]